MGQTIGYWATRDYWGKALFGGLRQPPLSLSFYSINTEPFVQFPERAS